MTDEVVVVVSIIIIIDVIARARPPFYESEISASFCVPLEAAGRGCCGFVQGFVRAKRRSCHDALRRFLPLSLSVSLSFFLPCLFSSALTSLILKGRMNNGRGRTHRLRRRRWNRTEENRRCHGEEGRSAEREKE